MNGHSGLPLATIGPYRIERELARGGMGVVYLAHDTRLGRTVALKALPPDVASDPERLDRFEREAKLLASLNHPNIGAIYDVVESDGRRYLALEHIEGESLAHRLSRGALSIPEAIEICLQIATGMEAAHERGVIHRDLKPGNVMITPGDQVKIVDFGLAKGATAPESDLIDSPTGSASSPTITSPAHSPGTIPGVILGTAPYLSPEQARGKPVDRRTDIWSWGCILYECLTGRMAFKGDTVSDTIAKILERDPDWSAIPRNTPDRVRELAEHCLEKDPRRRLRDIGDARIELERSLGEQAALARGGNGLNRQWIARSFKGALTLVAVLLALLAGTLLTRWLGSARPSPEVTRFSLSFPAHLDVWSWSLAPDGSALVIRGSERGGDSGAEGLTSRLYVRRFDSFDLRALPGTENASGPVFVTRDSRHALFVASTSYAAVNRTLVRVALDGSSPAMKLARWDPEWEPLMAPLPKGDIIVTKYPRELIRIPASGGAPRPLGSIVSTDSVVAFHLIRGDGCAIDDHTLLLRCETSDSLGYHSGIAVLDLRSRRARIVLRDGGNPVFSPTGYILLMRGDALFGLRWDPHGPPKGNAVGLMEGIRTPGSGVRLSSNGTLVYSPGGRVAEQRRLVVVERGGRIEPWSEDRRMFFKPYAPSWDGRRLGIGVLNDHGLKEIWIADLQRHELSRALTAPAADLEYPCLSPDGSHVVYRWDGTDSRNGIYFQRTDGVDNPIRLLSAPPDGSIRYFPIGWSGDGETVFLDKWIGNRAGLARIRVTAPRDTVAMDLFRRDDSQAMNGTPSPDGRWLAFQWDRTGRSKVYVAELRSDGSLGEPRRLSYKDGVAPHWSGDGRTIYWMEEAGGLVAAPFETSNGRIAGDPRVVLEYQSVLGVIPLPDGRLFAIQSSGEETFSILDVVLNWDRELDRKMHSSSK